MANLPSSLGKESVANLDRRSSSSSRPPATSHGRGGAGNIGYSSNDVEPESLETPHLKGDVYTTGRGGTGNMAKFTDAEEARRAQDVLAPQHRETISRTHIGRGGAANVYQPTHEDVAREKMENARHEELIANEDRGGDSDLGLAEKGKKWLMDKVGKS